MIIQTNRATYQSESAAPPSAKSCAVRLVVALICLKVHQQKVSGLMMDLPFSSHRSRKFVAVKSQIILRADGVYQSQKVHLVQMQFYAINPNSFTNLQTELTGGKSRCAASDDDVICVF